MCLFTACLVRVSHLNALSCSTLPTHTHQLEQAAPSLRHGISIDCARRAIRKIMIDIMITQLSSGTKKV
eukprot:4722052-Amphidinium_carterae.1